MAIRNTRKLPSAESVAAGATANFRVPIGSTIHQIAFTRGGTTFDNADINGVRVIANGVEIQRYASGADMNTIQQYIGRADASAVGGTHIIDFDSINMKTRLAEEKTALGTGVVNSEGQAITTLQVEIDIDSSAVAPTLQGFMVTSAPRPVELIRKVRRFQETVSAAGDFEISTLPKADLIRRIFIDGTAPTITNLKLERDNFIVFERTPALNNLIQNDSIVDRTSQANWQVIDFSELGFGSDALVTKNVNDLRLTVTTSGTGALPVYVEYVGGLEQ